MWGAEASSDKGAEPKTFYDLLVAEKDIVRMVLLLTGAIQSAKQGVGDFAKSFDQFSFLWMKDLAAEYATFLATNPNLEVLRCLPGQGWCCLGIGHNGRAHEGICGSSGFQ